MSWEIAWAVGAQTQSGPSGEIEQISEMSQTKWK